LALTTDVVDPATELAVLPDISGPPVRVRQARIRELHRNVWARQHSQRSAEAGTSWRQDGEAANGRRDLRRGWQPDDRWDGHHQYHAYVHGMGAGEATGVAG